MPVKNTISSVSQASLNLWLAVSKSTAHITLGFRDEREAIRTAHRLNIARKAILANPAFLPDPGAGLPVLVRW